MDDSKVHVLVVDEAPLAATSDSCPASNLVLDQLKPESQTDPADSLSSEASVQSPFPQEEPVFVPVTFEDPDNEEPADAAKPAPTESSESKCCLLV
jgi:hypothetical protein